MSTYEYVFRSNKIFGFIQDFLYNQKYMLHQKLKKNPDWPS